MPSGPPWVNVYLLPCPGGWMLIDTGMPVSSAWDALIASMSEIGVSPENLRHIVLTHMHPDHCGLAVRLREASGAEIWLHPEDAEFLSHLTSGSSFRNHLEDAMHAAGTSNSMRTAVLQAHDRFAAALPAFTADRQLVHGTTLDTWAGPLEVHHTPGHSPGLCCIHIPRLRYLISSDHLLEDITPHVGWLPGRDMLGAYLGTLDALSALDVERILPAHGFPYPDVASSARQIRRAHAKRLSEIETHLQDGAQTADDLVRRLWPRDLRPFEYLLALTSVLACREHAARRMRNT